ncbi:DUF2218 domain-containing protein [Glycomyces artemisiae]|uniref:DUF2218 domain-containing protein n=1 Tax=Glycomyces artemisiae TaxID=1076443 RepID=A0A2T0UAT0_9ACTN|nr:DUF2218 domain-containing protein [Glycomyces artemisiae]PRY54927.1 hypothetical protein B0I28_11337 [Glycomyces artemisiae]
MAKIPAPAALRGENGAVLSSRAVIATRLAGRYADLLAQRLGDKADVEPLPGGYRLSFSGGEGLVGCGPDTLSLIAIADDVPSLVGLRDLLRITIERLGHRDRLRVHWN